MCQYNAYLCTAFQKSSVEKRKNRHKLILIMKAKVSLKKLIVSSLFLTLGVSAFAFQNNDFVYNSKEVNGLKVSQSVYKNNNNLLSNYLEYHFKYDDQQRSGFGPAWTASGRGHRQGRGTFLRGLGA